MATNQPHEEIGPVGYLSLVLAWAVPGLGHLMLGERGRALLFGATVHVLFGLGLLLGGLHAINPPEQPLWTYTQFLSGWPMLVMNRLEKQFTESAAPGFKSPADALMTDYREQRGKIEAQYEAQKDELKNSSRAPGSGDDAQRQIETIEAQEAQAEQAFAIKYFAAHPLITNHPKVQDMGAVYCGIAGMLNLLLVLDVLLRVSGAKREEAGGKTVQGVRG